MKVAEREWTAGSSVAALVRLVATARSAFLSPAQIGLLQWELEKFGPRYDEPPANVVIRDGLRGLRAVAVLGIREVALLHGQEIMRLRGREALDRALVTAARVAARESTVADEVAELLYEVSSRAIEPVLASDAIAQLLPHPTAEEFLCQLRLAVAIVARPYGWTPAHALGFLLYAAHSVDGALWSPLGELARRMLSAAGFVYAETSAEVVLAYGEALYERCEGYRFVLFRAVEDQLMHFARSNSEVRNVVVSAVREAAGEATPDRRAIITAATAILGTHPRARYRERHCPDWPV